MLVKRTIRLVTGRELAVQVNNCEVSFTQCKSLAHCKPEPSGAACDDGRLASERE